MVGQRISQLRRSRNMTQRELAAALKVSPSAVGMYEQGRRQPSAELVVRICQVFSVSTQWLLTGRPYTTADFREDLKMLLACPPEDGAPPQGETDLRALLESLSREEPDRKAPAGAG